VRDFAMVAGGGAGPVHAAAIARELGIPTVVIPSVAALYSAFGMFAMDIGRDYARSYASRTDSVDIKVFNSLFAEMEKEAYADFKATGTDKELIKLTRTAEMRYVGQFHEVEVALPDGIVTAEQVSDIVDTFNRMHQTLFQFSMPGHKVEFSTFRLKAATPNAHFALKKIGVGNADSSRALKRRRSCIFSGKPIDTPIYDGGLLLAGNVVDGPAIVEESTTTVVIPEGFRCTVDESKNYVLRDTSAAGLN